MAMEARCYHGGENRTSMKPLKYHSRDISAYVCIFLYLGRGYCDPCACLGGAGMKRIMLEVAYDGTNYCGWQVQPNGITVQEVLNRHLSELAA